MYSGREGAGMAAEQRLPELIVKEAIGAGLDSPMRESILEAVEDAEGPRGGVSVPIAVGAVAVGTAIGYVLGSADSTTVPTEAESLPIETPDSTEDETEDDDTETGGSRLAKLLTLGAIAGAGAYLWRRRGGDDWEPIDDLEEPVEDATEAVETIASESIDTESAGDRITDAESTDEMSDDAETDHEDGSSDGETNGESETDTSESDSS